MCSPFDSASVFTLKQAHTLFYRYSKGSRRDQISILRNWIENRGTGVVLAHCSDIASQSGAIGNRGIV